jgi:anti-sigma-K factor RskA
MNTETEKLACLYVLDRLDPSQTASFEARLLHDPELAAIVGELESALERHIRDVPQVDPPAGLLGRIDSRIDGLASAAIRYRWPDGESLRSSRSPRA